MKKSLSIMGLVLILLTSSIGFSTDISTLSTLLVSESTELESRAYITNDWMPPSDFTYETLFDGYSGSPWGLDGYHDILPDPDRPWRDGRTFRYWTHRHYDPEIYHRTKFTAFTPSEYGDIAMEIGYSVKDGHWVLPSVNAHDLYRHEAVSDGIYKHIHMERYLTICPSTKMEFHQHHIGIQEGRYYGLFLFDYLIFGYGHNTPYSLTKIVRMEGSHMDSIIFTPPLHDIVEVRVTPIILENRE